MSMKNLKSFLPVVALFLFSTSSISLAFGRDSFKEIGSEVRKYTSNLPFRMPEIKLPEIPSVSFNIEKFGAVGNGKVMNTEAFRKTIDACSKAGGGTVIVPPGLWLTGPIELRSNIDFHVSRGALIVFSKNHADYPIIKSPTRGFVVASPLYGFDLHDVAITGDGVLDGEGVTWRPVKKSKVTAAMWKGFVKSGGVVTNDGKIWWPTKEAADGEQYLKNLFKTKKKSELTAADFLPARDYMRPILFMLSRCRNVLISGITLTNSPKFAMYPDRCEGVVIRHVKVNNEYWAQNGDGIDIASSKNVLLYKSTVTAGDDGICMKSSRDKSGNTALKNIVIADCIVYHAHGGFVIGSNTDGGMADVSVRNCDYIGTDIGLRFKSSRGRGGIVRNIFVSNIFMKDIVHQAILFTTYYEGFGKGEGPQPVNALTPIFEDFHIDSIYCEGAREAIRIDGLPEMPVKNVTILNSVISAQAGFMSDNASAISLKNVTILPEKGDIYEINNTKGLTIDNGFCPRGTDVFMNVAGKETNGIKILNTDLKSAKTPVQYGADVQRDAVTQK